MLAAETPKETPRGEADTHLAQADITIGDPTGLIPNYCWDMLHPEFPNVHYLDNYGGSGRTRAEFSHGLCEPCAQQLFPEQTL